MTKEDLNKRYALNKLREQVKSNIRYWADNNQSFSSELLKKDLVIDYSVFSEDEYKEIENIITGIKSSIRRFEMFCSNNDIDIH